MAHSPISGGSRVVAGKKKNWLGGYVRHGRKGPTFMIERWVDGTRYHVSTKCRTERAALEQLAIFEADPANYKSTRKARAGAPQGGVVMTADLITEYTDWMVNRPNNPTTDVHAEKHFTRLKKWLVFYRGRDIRRVPLSEIADQLKGQRDLMTKTQALKSFCAWLRTNKYLMTRAEDPTIDLQGPPRRATRDHKQVAVEPERILAILPHLKPETRDVLILRLGTGWHGREVERFANTGRIRRTPGRTILLMGERGAERVPLLAVLQVKHKIGGNTNTPILYEEHLAAAERIQQRGRVPNQLTLNRHVTKACEQAGVERFLNWHIRHSVVSNALEEGADLEHASVFVDHLSINTTRKHYAQIALPKKAVPVLRVVDGGKKKTAG